MCSYAAWPLLAPLAAVRRRSLRNRVAILAVIGSFGKTTTTKAVRTVLDCKPVTAHNYWSFLALGILRLRKTARFAAFEVGVTKPGQMRNFARVLRPDVTLVTSIGSEHLLSMGSMEKLRFEKSQMFSNLDSRGVVVLNGDDPNVLWMRSQTQARVITFGFGEENDFRASEYRIDWPKGTTFRLNTDAGSWVVELPLFGRTAVYSALAAAVAGVSQGIEMKEILERLAGVKPVAGRMQPMKVRNGSWVLRDDFKSGLETITAAIRTLSEIEVPRRIAVMGDISEEIGSVRPVYREIGADIAHNLDLLLLTGRHARSIAVGARRAGMDPETVINCEKDIFRAAEYLQSYLRPGDVVLLKGRYEQRLRRIAFILADRTVNCRLRLCTITGLQCEECPALKSGWPSRMIRI